MKYHLIFGFRIMPFCLSLGFYNLAYASIIIDSIVETEEICDLANGTITIIAQGGISPLSYSIDGGLTFQSNNYFPNLDSHDYLIVVSDGTSCTEIQTAQITSADTPKIDISQDCVLGTGLVDIDLIPFTTGIPPFSFEWTGPEGTYDTEDLTLVPTGNYTVTVYDRDGCQVDTSFNIPICCHLQVESSSAETTLNCITDLFEVSNLTFDTLVSSKKEEALKNLLGIDLISEPCNEITIDITSTEEFPDDCSEPVIVTRVVEITDGVQSGIITKTYLISDNIAPEINCPSALSIESNEDLENEISSWLSSSYGSDNCSSVKLADNFDFNILENDCPFEQEVEFSIFDECDNFSSCLSTITVGSSNEILLTCPDKIELGCSSVKPDSLIYQVLDSMTIQSKNPWEVDYEYSLDIYDIGCDFVYTFDANVRIFDSCDREAECSVRVDVEPIPEVYIPNIFSPGVRNVQNLTVYGNPVIEEVEVFHIYNRWGRTVHEEYNFQANDESVGWNGNINNESNDMEVFTYFVICRSIAGKELKYTGNVTLLK